MDILLTTPINKTHYCVPSLGLGYLASSLRKSGLDSVSILDPVRGGLGYSEFAALLKEKKPKILGIQCYSFDVPSVIRMLKIAKDINPGITTVIGGPHPTAVAEAIFSELANLDFAILGEGEISFPQFVKAVFSNDADGLKRIPGLAYREEDRVAVNAPASITDLGSLDMPAWDLMDIRTYPAEVQGGFYKGYPVAPVITSRGCPFECTFCANRILMGRGLRFRPIQKVVDEIQHLVENFNAKEIHILDDNFTINKKRVFDFCQEIRQRKIKVNFAFPNGMRVDTVDEQVLSALKGIGAYSVTLGIESGSQRILDHMKKVLDISLIREKVDLIKKAKLIINAFFIIGYPYEQKEDILKTIAFAKELPIDVAHFSCFLPLPGTEITEELLRSGEIKEINYAELFYSKVPFSPRGITKIELKKLQRKAFLSFYLRPRIWIGILFRLKSWAHFNSIFKRGIDYILRRG